MKVKITSPAKRLSVYIGEKYRWQGLPLYHAIVLAAKEMGLAGATVYRCIEGYGANSRLRTSRLLDLSIDLPIVIDIIDNEDYLAKFLPKLDEMVQEGLIIIEDVKVIKYQQQKDDK